MEITKTANPTNYTEGELVTYTYTVTNIGNVTLSNVQVTDNLTTTVISPLSPTTLGPGDVGIETATYQTTQQDYDNGTVTNLATVTGKLPDGGIVSNQTTATIKATGQKENLKITKVASPSSYDHVGELITYTYTVTNIGNVDTPEPLTVYDNEILGGQITIGSSGSVL